MQAPDPWRVVVFTGGPELQPDVLDFIQRLEDIEDIEVVGVFCETGLQGFRGVVADLWRRRRLMAIPLLLQRWLRMIGRGIFQPRRSVFRRWTGALIAPRLQYATDLHSASLLARIRDLEPDLGLVYGGPIIRPELFELPRHGTLGIHHGLTPAYRGKKTTFWAMYNGEKSVGVTIQTIGRGLDRGDIVAEATIPVGRAPLPVVSARLQRLGLELYMHAIDEVRRGKAEYRPQSSGSGVLYRDPSAADVLRFWARYVSGLFSRRDRP
jgi:folate-dependent phosphoribosylglycinamide formyltransferase PurN